VGDNPDGPSGDNRDGIGIANSSTPPYNIIIDHCSVSWAIDENMQLWYPCHDITIQWCITSEALDNSLHSKGPHSKGMIIGPDAQRISIHHNLFAHNVERNPLISVDTESEVINNVVYNWQGRGLNLGNCYPEHGEKSNVIGNYFKPGPSSNNNAFHISDCWANAEVYLLGNIGPGRPIDSGDEWSLVNNDVGDQIISTEPALPPSGIATYPAIEAYTIVLDNAGAVIPERDAVDWRIVQSVHDSTGSIIDSQDETGGWPSYAPGTPPQDTDHDGMPDAWENDRELDPSNPSDANEDINNDGYTNVEEYLNGLIDAVVSSAAVKQNAAKYKSRFMVLNDANSFNSSIRIIFNIYMNSNLYLHIYDIKGNLVKTLLKGRFAAGTHMTTWDGRDNKGREVARGIYSVTLKSANYIRTEQLILLR
jgi:hypothetical protein